MRNAIAAARARAVRGSAAVPRALPRGKMLDTHRPIVPAMEGSAYGLNAPSQPSGKSLSAGAVTLGGAAPLPDCFATVVVRAALSTANRIFPCLSRITTSDIPDIFTAIEAPAPLNALEPVKRSPFPE